MIQKNIDNHYVPKMYLKNCSLDGKTVWMYRRLVSHNNVKWWKKQSINNIAFLSHLYSHMREDSITDEFENWLNHQIETPAKPSIEKAITGSTLSSDELLALLRFTAAQIVRTPAYYIKHYEDWISSLPQVMIDTMKKVCDSVTIAIEEGKPLPSPKKTLEDELIPIKLSRVTRSDGISFLKATTSIGRAMWLSHIRRMSTVNVSALQKHKWHIIEAAPDVEWPTSDDPVICLNYSSHRQRVNYNRPRNC